MSDLPAGRTLARPHLFHPGTTTPPVLLLHGTGDDEHGLVPLGQQLAPGAALLSPRGTVLEGSMPRFFRRLAEGVFDEDDLRGRTDELAAFLVAAGEGYQLEPGSLVAVGFSNGANMAAAMLLTHPEALAGAVLIAARAPFAEAPAADLTGKRVLVSNGQRDPMAPASDTERLAAELRERGADVDLQLHPGGHELYGGHLQAMRSLISSI